MDPDGGELGHRRRRLSGYGVLSGRRLHWKIGDSYTPRGIVLRGMTDCSITGLTIVDHGNHHMILVGAGAEAARSSPNTLRHVKVFGWRTNGDGLHLWGHWNDVTDLFLRTQDDSTYVGDEASDTTFRRITTWNDANGVPFMLGSQNGAPTLVEDCDVLYHRKQFPYWCGAIFDGRGYVERRLLGGAKSVTFRNIRILDPFPTCPLLDATGSYVNTYFENVVMAAHSTFTRLPAWYCAQSYSANPLFRFLLNNSFGCDLPFGIPSILIGGTCHHDDGLLCTTLADTSYNFTNLQFNNVTVNGTDLYELMTSTRNGRGTRTPQMARPALYREELSTVKT